MLNCSNLIVCLIVVLIVHSFKQYDDVIQFVMISLFVSITFLTHAKKF
jgi:hypothetical protein